MPWNATFPLGSVSVKANKTIGQQNTTYIQVTMGNSVVGTNTVTTRDHFWNVSSNLDGRHRFIQSPAFTVGSVATDPVIGTGMDGVLYLKTTNGRAQGFYRNSQGIYQYIPNFLSGTATITSSSSYDTVVAVPANVYGEIVMWRTTNGKNNAQSGFFRSDGSTVQAWANYLGVQGSSQTLNLKFGNGTDASGLNIRARAESASVNHAWNYRITYRAI